jgi:hypothetical protein
VFLALAILSVAMLAGACGGSGGPTSASDWLPDLKALGFTGATQSPALINGDKGSAVEVYSRADPPGEARVDVALFKNGGEAATAFATTSTQLAALPPGLFGANATQEKTQGMGKGDSNVSYVTKTPDGSGNRVWTDTYRFGDAVVVAFVIAKDETSAAPVRESIADQLAKK